MSDVQDLEIEMRRALEKNDGSTWKTAIELYNAGWRKCVGEVIQSLEAPTPYERAAAAIEELAKCMKGDQSLRLLGTDDAAVNGLTLMETRRRTTKF